MITCNVDVSNTKMELKTCNTWSDWPWIVVRLMIKLLAIRTFTVKYSANT